MALHTASGLYQVTKHAWRHPARLAHEPALTRMQQARLLHSTARLSAAHPNFSDAATSAIQEAATANTAAGFESYEQLVARSKSPDGILTRSRDRFFVNKLGMFAGILLRKEPAGTLFRLRASDKDKSLESALATADMVTFAHDIMRAEDTVQSDSKRDNLLVFQTSQRQISARGMRNLLEPGSLNLSVTEVDLFKIPKQLLTPFMGLEHEAAATAAAVNSSADGSSSVQQEVTVAILAGKAAGPFAAVGYTAVSRLVRDITTARMALLQASSGSNSSGDFCCRVARAPADSRPDYEQAARAATIEQQNPPKFVFAVTVYPCARWPETPREDRVAAVAASAAAVTVA